jgi:hypothetical protein
MLQFIYCIYSLHLVLEMSGAENHSVILTETLGRRGLVLLLGRRIFFQGRKGVNGRGTER